jgi:peroxiredoxin
MNIADSPTDERENSPMSSLPKVAKSKGWQQRIRESRLGTLLVLAVTATIVIVGAYMVDRPATAAAGIQAIALSGPADGAPPKIGSPAQDFTATTVDGKKVSLSSFKGHPVWLTFGATWCAACKAEAPDIQAAYKKFEAKGVVVLAIFIREDSVTVKDYGDRIGLTFPKVADPDTRIASAYRVFGIPAHFFIDRTGVLRSIKTGGQSPEQMSAALTAISR